MKRRWLVMAVVAVAAASFPACGEGEAADDEVREAIRRTEKLARRFQYTDQSGGQGVLVQGVIEDDFRYRTRLSLNEESVVEQVVNDDAIALRIFKPEFVEKLVVKRPDTVRVPTGTGNATVAVPISEALGLGRWVVDRRGAPTIEPSEKDNDRLGLDPMFDALTVLRYAERAINEVPFVRRFNPEALDYKPAEDPFPHPPEGSGIKRYDYQRPGLPRRAQAAAGGNEAVPELRHFRRLSLYVKDGIIVEMFEEIDVETRLRELGRIYDVDFGDVPPSEAARVAVDAINALRRGQGKEPMRVRSMSLRLTEFGKVEKVELPPDAITGPVQLVAAEARADTAGSTTTTTAPPG